MKAKIYAYWTATIILALELLVGGLADLAQRAEVTRVMAHLGYPSYFVVILGAWKVAAVFAVLLPRFPRLKEWAYAGAIFETTGAAASHAAAGDSLGNLLVPLAFALIAIVSWALRPSDRLLGSLQLAKHYESSADHQQHASLDSRA